MKRKPTFLAAVTLTLIACASPQAGEILAAWDCWPDVSRIDAPHTQANISAGVSVELSAKGSNDKTFGTLAGASISSSSQSGHLATKAEASENYIDVDALIALDDAQLAPGESATVQLTISGGKGTAPMFIGNLAVTEKLNDRQKAHFNRPHNAGISGFVVSGVDKPQRSPALKTRKGRS